MRTIALLLFLSFNLTLTAQNYDFGKVSKEEIEEKFNPLDTSANATYLYKYRRTYFKYIQEIGFQQITDVHERIKIHNKEGVEYATKKINLYKNGSEKEGLNSLKAYTYNLINGKVEETKLEKDGIFNSEESKFYDQKKFTMPNIKEGSVIEFKYSVVSPFISNVDEFDFQHEIPIKKLEAVFEAPEYFNFKVNSKGYLPLNGKTERKSDKIMFRSKSRSADSWSSTKTTFNSEEVTFNKSISTYSLSDIPALKDEPFVNNINNYRSAIKYELSFTAFPQTPLKYYSTTWEDVVKTIYNSPRFGNELDKSGYYEDELNALIGSNLDPKARIAMIFDFVKSKVKWNGYYGKYCDDGVKKAYKTQLGNAAEINLMLTSMLRYAGLEANPVLVSTRHNGIPLFPTLEGYNYVISSVETPEGHILLDATNKYGVPNVLPFRTLNWEGRIIKKDKISTTINLYPNENSNNSNAVLINLNEQGLIEGNLRAIKTNHEALLYRDGYIETNKEQFLEKLENKYGGMEVADFQVANDLDLTKPVTESYKFSLENQADMIDNKLYFSPMFFLKTKLNPFKLESREFPVDFGYPNTSSYRISINLPEGYTVETMPTSFAMQLPDDIGSFSYRILNENNVLQIMVSEKINQPIISAIHYSVLKEYFTKLVEKEAEQVVLIKT